MDQEASTSTLQPAVSASRPKRVQPSRSRRTGDSIGNNDIDLMILDKQKRRWEYESILPETTRFLLTTNPNIIRDASQAEKNALRLNPQANDRYFDRPDVLQAYRAQKLIETPDWDIVEEDTNISSRFRHRGGVDANTPDPLSNEIAEQRFKKYENFEKRHRLREQEQLKHLQYKLKERMEQLQNTDSAAFLSLPAESFTKPPPGSFETANEPLPTSHVFDPKVYPEGERRRKEMLSTAAQIEKTYRLTLAQPRKAKAPAAARDAKVLQMANNDEDALASQYRDPSPSKTRPAVAGSRDRSRSASVSSRRRTAETPAPEPQFGTASSSTNSRNRATSQMTMPPPPDPPSALQSGRSRIVRHPHKASASASSPSRRTAGPPMRHVNQSQDPPQGSFLRLADEDTPMSSVRTQLPSDQAQNLTQSNGHISSFHGVQTLTLHPRPPSSPSSSPFGRGDALSSQLQNSSALKRKRATSISEQNEPDIAYNQKLALQAAFDSQQTEASSGSVVPVYRNEGRTGSKRQRPNPDGPGVIAKRAGACNECSNRKKACRGGEPCDSCLEMGTRCVFKTPSGSLRAARSDRTAPNLLNGHASQPSPGAQSTRIGSVAHGHSEPSQLGIPARRSPPLPISPAPSRLRVVGPLAPHPEAETNMSIMQQPSALEQLGMNELMSNISSKTAETTGLDIEMDTSPAEPTVLSSAPPPLPPLGPSPPPTTLVQIDQALSGAIVTSNLMQESFRASDTDIDSPSSSAAPVELEYPPTAIPHEEYGSFPGLEDPQSPLVDRPRREEGLENMSREDSPLTSLEAENSAPHTRSSSVTPLVPRTAYKCKNCSRLKSHPKECTGGPDICDRCRDHNLKTPCNLAKARRTAELMAASSSPPPPPTTAQPEKPDSVHREDLNQSASSSKNGLLHQPLPASKTEIEVSTSIFLPLAGPNIESPLDSPRLLPSDTEMPSSTSYFLKPQARSVSQPLHIVASNEASLSLQTRSVSDPPSGEIQTYTSAQPRDHPTTTLQPSADSPSAPASDIEGARATTPDLFVKTPDRKRLTTYKSNRPPKVISPSIKNDSTVEESDHELQAPSAPPPTKKRTSKQRANDMQDAELEESTSAPPTKKAKKAPALSVPSHIIGPSAAKGKRRAAGEDLGQADMDYEGLPVTAPARKGKARSKATPKKAAANAGIPEAVNADPRPSNVEPLPPKGRSTGKAPVKKPNPLAAASVEPTVHITDPSASIAGPSRARTRREVSAALTLESRATATPGPGDSISVARKKSQTQSRPRVSSLLQMASRTPSTRVTGRSRYPFGVVLSPWFSTEEDYDIPFGYGDPEGTPGPIVRPVRAVSAKRAASLVEGSET